MRLLTVPSYESGCGGARLSRWPYIRRVMSAWALLRMGASNMFKSLIAILADSFRQQTRAAVNRSIMQGATEGIQDAFATLSGESIELPNEAAQYLDTEPEPTPKKKPARAATKRK